ncbi:MAG: hypothetical protein IPK07_04435 [Deltaproteobacteria bacterium]|nr:hypothetical protein [Deltaproteobacteria bacterium]
MSERRTPLAALAVGFAALGAFYLYWGTSTRLLSFGGDNATYLLIARDLSPFGGHSPGAAGYASQSYYPPLYPAVMAITGAAQALAAAHAFTITILVAAFAIAFAWYRSLGLGSILSALLVLAVAGTRGTYMTALEIESEPLYLALTLVALAATRRDERDGAYGWRGWLAPSAVGAATLTRSAGLAMLVAYLVYLAVRRPRLGWLRAVVATVPTLAWVRVGGNSDYGRILVERYRDGGLTALVETVASQLATLWAEWLGLFAVEPVGLVVVVVSGVTVLALAGLLLRLRRGALEALYLGAYLALIVIWPFPGEMARFLVVTIPIVLGLAALAAREGLERLPPGRARAWVAVGLWAGLGSVLVPQLALTAARFHGGATPELGALRRSALWYDPDRVTAEKTLHFAARLEDALARVAEHVPRNGCVFSVKPSLVGLFADRRAIYTPPASVADEPFHAEVERAGCRWFFLIAAGTQSAAPLYPRDRFEPPLDEVDVTRMGEDPESRLVSILAALPSPASGAQPLATSR